MRKIDEHWYEAEKDGKRGLVPSNYLEVSQNSRQECINIIQWSGRVFKRHSSYINVQSIVDAGHEDSIQRLPGAGWGI